MDAYEDAYRRFQTFHTGKEEYIDLAKKVADSLGIENAEILIQQGRYEELNKEIDEYLKKKKLEAADAAADDIYSN